MTQQENEKTEGIFARFVMENKSIDQSPEEFLLEIKKSLSANKTEKAKIDYLSHLAASIQPDPIQARLCKAGCHGRGFRYIDVSLDKNTVHYKIDLCCGVVGTSPYAKIFEKLILVNERMENQVQLFKGGIKMLEQHDYGITAGIKALEICAAENFEDIKNYQLFRKICKYLKILTKR